VQTRDLVAHLATLLRKSATSAAGRAENEAPGTVTPGELEGMVDRALATKLVTPDGIEAELARLAQRGPRGIGTLRAALNWRPAAASQPSVLESSTLRLLHGAGVKPLAVEVRVSDDLSCRVDILLRPGLALEVDGYTYHHSPEQMADDARRRNRLHLGGTQVLVYTWRDIVYDGHRVIAEVRKALGQPSMPAPAPTELVGRT